jgi:hypothetical protein
MTGGGKGVYELGADLITAGADARSDGRNQVFRFRAIFAGQRLNSGDRCARSGPAPPGVHGRNRTSHRIRKKQWHAIGGAHRDGDIWIV